MRTAPCGITKSPYSARSFGGFIRQKHLTTHLRRLLAAEVCASAVVMLDTPCSEVGCKTTGYPLHSHVSPSLPIPSVTVCHQVSTELYVAVGLTAKTLSARLRLSWFDPITPRKFSFRFFAVYSSHMNAASSELRSHCCLTKDKLI